MKKLTASIFELTLKIWPANKTKIDRIIAGRIVLIKNNNIDAFAKISESIIEWPVQFQFTMVFFKRFINKFGVKRDNE